MQWWHQIINESALVQDSQLISTLLSTSLMSDEIGGLQCLHRYVFDIVCFWMLATMLEDFMVLQKQKAIL